MNRVISTNKMILALLIAAFMTISMVYGQTEKTTLQDIAEENTQNAVSEGSEYVTPTRKSWKYQNENVAVYAFQGMESNMKNELVISENIYYTGVSFFAIFDGHGGDFSSKFVAKNFTDSLEGKVRDLVGQAKYPYLMKYRLLDGDIDFEKLLRDEILAVETKLLKKLNIMKRKKITDALIALRKQKDEKLKSPPYDVNYYHKLVEQGILTSKESEALRKSKNKKRIYPILNAQFTEKIDKLLSSTYTMPNNGDFNYEKLLTDGIITNEEKSTIESTRWDESGTTILAVLSDGQNLYVANVGNSRAVMDGQNGDVVALSKPHEPDNANEIRRLREAGAVVDINKETNMWQVDGQYSSPSRSLGNLKAKSSRYIIPTPDTFTFNLQQYEPQFLILASNGFWEKLKPEEAVKQVNGNFQKPLLGADVIALESKKRGALGDVTVMVVKMV